LRPCDSRLKCGHSCPYKVRILDTNSNYAYLPIYSVILMTNITLVLYARNVAQDFVFVVIRATKNVPSLVEHVNFLLSMSNFHVAIRNPKLLGIYSISCAAENKNINILQKVPRSKLLTWFFVTSWWKRSSLAANTLHE
jgi:hypothetical protein